MNNLIHVFIDQRTFLTSFLISVDSLTLEDDFDKMEGKITYTDRDLEKMKLLKFCCRFFFFFWTDQAVKGLTG